MKSNLNEYFLTPTKKIFSITNQNRFLIIKKYFSFETLKKSL